jgi:hypothetical protein
MQQGIAPRYTEEQTEVVVSRLIAAVASFFLTAETTLPLALACCNAPAAHECCAKEQSRRPSDPELGRAPCCRSESKTATNRKDDALKASISRASQLVPLVATTPKVAVIAVMQIVAVSRSTLRAARALEPPVPLRI